MDRNDLVTALFQISLFLTVFSIGLKSTLRDTLYLFRYPRSFMLSVLSMAVIMPALAVSATLLLDLHPAVELALVALSVSPVPPFLPLRVVKAGGKPAYTLSLLAITAVLSVVVIPVAVTIFSRVYAVEFRRHPLDILPVALTSVLLPLAFGMLARISMPAFAIGLSNRLPLVAMALLLVSVLSILLTLREEVLALIGVPTLAALGGFALLGYLVGDLLGGLKPEDRTVLAFATAMRHPGIALAVAQGTSEAETVVSAAVLLYLIMGILASGLYMAGRRRLDPGLDTPPPIGDPGGFRPV
jgi:BASS family bile acid:Na+ symporter